MLKWNVTTFICQGSNFSFLAAFYFAQLELLPCLQALAWEDGNKGSNFKEGENNRCCKERKQDDFPQKTH